MGLADARAEIIKLGPQPGAQEAFLSSPADVVFYGGAAGGGKTFAMLLEPLRHISAVSGFGAVIFRRETPQITNEGALWDEAGKLYPYLDGRSRYTQLDWTFPPYGNRIKFAHMEQEDDRLGWDGAQIPLIMFDQLEQFTRLQFFYMFSRNRSTCGVRPYVRAGYNPVPAGDAVGGWIHEFVDWYLDDNGEYPDPDKAGVIRWFVNVNDTLHWFGSRAGAVEAFPRIPPKSFTYIPASVFDNKILLTINPEYLANLYALPTVEQERLLGSNHKIIPMAGKVINRDWLRIVDRPPAAIVHQGRFWDFAATEKKRKAGAATASVKQCKAADGSYGILDMTEDWLGAADVDAHAVAVARQDGYAVWQWWEEEGGSSGKRTTASLAAKMAGLLCAGVRPTGDKLDRLRPFAAQCKAGNVWLLRGAWNDRLLSYLHNAPDGRWDVRDCCSGGFGELAEMPLMDVLVMGKAKTQMRR